MEEIFGLLNRADQRNYRKQWIHSQIIRLCQGLAIRAVMTFKALTELGPDYLMSALTIISIHSTMDYYKSRVLTGFSTKDYS